MTEEKKCFKCELVKPLGDFYRHLAMSDGRLGKCKECTKKDANQHRADNLEQIRQYDRDRGNLPHRVESRKEYASTKEGKTKLREGSKRWIERNPEKHVSQNAVSNAVRDGRLEKFPCAICGSKNSQGHHEDYSKPLEVIWFCPKHHAEHHKNKREEERRTT